MSILAYIIAVAAAVQLPGDGPRVKGFVIGSGQWGAPGKLLDSQSGRDAMEAAKADGATWVRLIPTAYVANKSSTTVYPNNKMGFRTDTVDEVAAAAAAAKAMGLRVWLSPIIDPDWSDPRNCRAGAAYGCTGGKRQRYPVSRGEIGSGFQPEEWANFFASFRAWFQPYAVAARDSVDAVSVGTGLGAAARNAGSDIWKDWIAWIRGQVPSRSAVVYDASADTLASKTLPPWFAELDMLGVDTMSPLFALDIGISDQMTYWSYNQTIPSQAQFAQAWAPHIQRLRTAAQSLNTSLVFSSAGFQSRWGSWRDPSGVMVLDPTDGSCWERSVNLEVQSRLYSALLEALEPEAESWWGGLFWWKITLDSQGGTSDDGFTPYGKPAEGVVKAAWGGAGGRTSMNPTRAALAELPPAPKGVGPRNATKINSAVFGAGMWSSPNYRLGSAGANQSLSDLRAAGANYVRFITSWFFNSDKDSSSIWPANGTSHLRSDPFDELAAAVAHAKSLGMGCHIAPYIDANFDNMENCRGPSCGGKIPGTPPKAGRGSVCAGCDDAGWDAYFASYNDYILKHAVFAEAHDCGILSIGSELTSSFEQEAHFRDLIAKVRKVYSGNVTIAININLAVPGKIGFVDELDLVGVEGYYSLKKAPSGATVAQLKAAWGEVVADLETYHKSHGKPIMFTEVGYQSRADSHLSPASTNATDPRDCSVTALCVDLDEQANVYEALLAAMYPQPWFTGVNWWLWRADPTAGGRADYSFTPQGKPATLAVMKKWYNWYN